MGTSLTSIKLPTELVDAARSDAALFSRSIGGQVEHWANIGRAIESAQGFTLDRVRGALAGRFDASLLTDDEAVLFDDLFGASLDIPATAEARAFRASFAGQPNTDQ